MLSGANGEIGLNPTIMWLAHQRKNKTRYIVIAVALDFRRSAARWIVRSSKCRRLPAEFAGVCETKSAFQKGMPGPSLVRGKEQTVGARKPTCCKPVSGFLLARSLAGYPIFARNPFVLLISSAWAVFSVYFLG